MHASRRDFVDFAAAGLAPRLGESSPLARAASIDQGLQRLFHQAAPFPSGAVAHHLWLRG